MGPLRVTAASGDRIGHENNDGFFAWYGAGIYLGSMSETPGVNSRVRGCNFAWAGIGTAVDAWPYTTQLEIKHCRFRFCCEGVVACPTGTQTRVAVRNCLFHHLNVFGVFTTSGGVNDAVLIQNGTFAHIGGWGVVVGDVATTIRNCLFNDFGTSWILVFPGGPGWSAQHCYGDEAGEDNPSFDPGNPPVPDISERFYLNPRLSPCNDAGDTSVLVRRLADYTTWRTGSADRGRVDIGYHYGPVCGGGDTDGDGMQIGYGMDDNWEIFHFGSIAARNGTEDDDGDGMNTKDEYMFKSNPRVGDIPVRLYRNDAYTSPITDWDEWPGHNRQSPRFVFSSQDPIYIEVVGIQNYWWVQEVFTNEIKVTSEADPANPVYVTLTETGQDTNVFRSTNEPLYLSTQTIVTHLPTGGHKIKVVDEDTLTFSFETVTSGVSRQVLIDRGEFAGCGVEYFYNQQALWLAHDICNWFCSGDAEFSDYVGGPGDNPMAAFIRKAGEDTSHSRQADFLYMVAHSWLVDGYGKVGAGRLWDGDSPDAQLIFDPDEPTTGIRVQSDWNQDFEWALVHACWGLTEEMRPEYPTPPYLDWSHTLRGIPRRGHGLLGFENETNGALYWAIKRFWTSLDPLSPSPNKTFIEAP